MSWSPSTTVGVRHGRHRASEMVGAYSETTGVPTAAATWAAPVLPTTTADADAMTSARPSRSVAPPRSTTSRPWRATDAPAAVVARRQLVAERADERQVALHLVQFVVRAMTDVQQRAREVLAVAGDGRN